MNYSKRVAFGCSVIIIGFFVGAVQKASAKTADEAALEQLKRMEATYTEFGNELLSTNHSSFTPHTGDPEADRVLREFHEMSMEQNVVEFHLRQAKALALLKQWKDEQDTQLKALSKKIDEQDAHPKALIQKA